MDVTEGYVKVNIINARCLFAMALSIQVFLHDKTYIGSTTQANQGQNYHPLFSSASLPKKSTARANTIHQCLVPLNDHNFKEKELQEDILIP